MFPELGLTGYTCNDLFFQKALQNAALDGLCKIAEATGKGFTGLALIGLPLCIDDQIFNCAAGAGERPNSGHRAENIFADLQGVLRRPLLRSVIDLNMVSKDGAALCTADVPFGIDLLFAADNADGLIVGAEILARIFGYRFRRVRFNVCTARRS